MARVKQFAKDMGMSYNQANNLVKKGRALKDGGSSVLESTMNKAKVIKANKGKITKLDTKNPGKAKVNQFKNVQNAAAAGKISQKDALDKIRKIVLSKRLGGGFPDLSGDGKTTMKDVLMGRGVIPKPKSKTMKAKKGAIVKMRGGGLAVQGTKFSGVY
jgi:hypothetical protein